MAITAAEFEELAEAPRRTENAEGTVVERSVDELIKADQYLQGKSVTAVPWGLRIARTKPPGAVGDLSDY